jgi:hypothetical protein
MRDGSDTGSANSLSTLDDLGNSLLPEGSIEFPDDDQVEGPVSYESYDRPKLVSIVAELIAEARKGKLSDVVSADTEPTPTPKYILAITSTLLVGRAFSCTYRYVTTQEAQQFIGKEPFVHQYGQNWWTILTTTGALLFFTTDAFLTIIGSKDSLTDLCSFRETFKKNIALLRDQNGNLPLLKLVGWGLLLPGGMYGAFLKGKVGMQITLSQLTSAITDSPPAELSPLFSGLAYFSASSSLICYFAFQTQQALTQLRIMHALSDNPAWLELRKRDKWHLILNVAISFIISVAMALITMMSAFYEKGSFEVEWQTATKSLFIAILSIISNTLYTSTPNNVSRNIQSEHNDFVHRGDRPNPHGLPYFAVMAIAMISSTGNSLAVFPSIMHIMKLISGQDLQEESWTNVAIGLAIAAFLGVAMFPRDFNYNGKRAIETLFPASTAANDSATPELPAISKKGCFARLAQCLFGSSANAQNKPTNNEPTNYEQVNTASPV